MPRSLAAALAAALISLVAAATASAAHVIPVTVCDEAHLRAALTNLPHTATVRFECDGKIVATPQGGGPIQVITDRPNDQVTLDGTGRRVVISSVGGQALWFAGPRTTLRGLTFAHADNDSDERTPGGGAVLTFTPLVVDHVLFRANHAFNAGGAIAVRGLHGALRVRDSVFEDNSVLCTISSAGLNGGGGAISVKAGGPTTISNTIFRRNAATGNCTGGGAVMAPRSFRTSETGPITITDSHFRDNRLEAVNFTLQAGGGAIGVYNRTLSIDGTRFVGNDVTGPFLPGTTTGGGGIGFGGAVYVDQQTDGLLPPLATTITDSRFEDNEPSFDRPGYEHLGGALAFRDLQGTPSIEHSKFVSNHADVGGAIYSPSALSLDASRLLGNVADEVGGGLLVGSGRVTLAHTELIANRPQGCAAFGVHDLVLGLDVIETSPRGSCAALAASP